MSACCSIAFQREKGKQYTRNLQHTAHSIQHTARSTQHAARSTQHTAHSTHGLTLSRQPCGQQVCSSLIAAYQNTLRLVQTSLLQEDQSFCLAIQDPAGKRWRWGQGRYPNNRHNANVKLLVVLQRKDGDQFEGTNVTYVGMCLFDSAMP